MTSLGTLLSAVLLAAAVAVAWPSGLARRRLRDRRRGTRRPWLSITMPALGTWPDLLAGHHPRRVITLAAVTAGGAGWLAGGPVAALAGAVYGGLGARAATRTAASRRDATSRARDLDDLCALAADLRAGLPPAAAVEPHGTIPGATSTPPATPGTSPAGSRLPELTAAVWRLAERTGAPAADLVERIEQDARAADRTRAAAAAEAAGARATALLLAALPLGGIALGYAIGADPLRVLLHTPLGAACAAGALVLQVVGLWWADRITSGAAR